VQQDGLEKKYTLHSSKGKQENSEKPSSSVATRGKRKWNALEATKKERQQAR